MQEKQKGWNAKVKCTAEFNPGKGTTLNKVYEISGGKITYDNGEKSWGTFENIDKLNGYNKSKFKEVKRGRPKKQ